MGEVTETARAVTIRIDGTPAYSLSPNSRRHWRVQRRETKDAHWAVKQALSWQWYPLFKFENQVRLHWTVYLAKGGRKRDTDNALASMKGHLDALVHEGVIPGDSPKHIPETPTVEQITWGKHKGDPHIEVRIEQAAGAPQAGGE